MKIKSKVFPISVSINTTCIFLAAIAALYALMSVGLSVRPSTKSLNKRS